MIEGDVDKSTGHKLKETLFDHSVPFQNRCFDVFKFQVENNPVYRRFASVIEFHNAPPSTIESIPLLPIRAFKQSRLICEGLDPELIFKSSGTGNMARSTHYVANSSLYENAIRNEFYRYFPPEEYAILSYLPGYTKNPDSSLIWMIKNLLAGDTSGLSRFLELGQPLQKKTLKEITQTKKKILLFGAAFGLLDLIEMNSVKLPEGSVIIETGGMKTHRRELSKTELRETLSHGFKIPLHNIHSEYGMCELMSQFYAIGDEWFTVPHWTRVTIRRAEDPAAVCESGEEGKIGIIDLANLYSCPFLLTDDRGVMDSNGRFKVLGRWNPDDLRGCNFLIDRE